MTERASKPSPARATGQKSTNKLSLLLAGGLLLILLSLGVRIWWAKTAPARLARAMEVARSQRNAALLKQAQEAVKANPKDWRAYDRLAAALMATGQPDQALEQWRLGAKAAPGEKAAWQVLANAYLAQRRMAAAEETYRTITEKWPNDGAALEGLAAVQRHTGRLLEALKTARRAARLAGDRPEPHYILGAIIQEVVVRSPFVNGETALMEEGHRHLLLASKKLKDQPDLEYRLGRICLLTRRNDEALKVLEAAAEHDPGRTVIWIALSEARIRLGDVEGSTAAARKACETGPLDADAQMALGRALLLKSDRASLEAGTAAFQEAVRRNPTSAEAQQRLGTALLRLDRLRDAGAAFERAAQLDPNNAYPVQQLAVIYQRAGDRERSAQAAKLSKILTTNARLLDQLQRTAVAHPENPLIHRALGDRYQELGWLPQAETEYHATLAITPKDAKAMAGLGAVRRKIAEKTPQ